jgi:hypothetical protein
VERDNIFILLDGRLFQRTIGIPKDRNRPPILAGLLLHVYEAFCLEELLKNKNRDRRPSSRINMLSAKKCNI